MVLQALSFPALIPAEGFRWIYRDQDDHWRSAEPPADWTAADYLAASSGDPADRPELSNRFYLAASLQEMARTSEERNTDFGELVNEPDLYLKFASEKGPPQRLKELANKFGLLDPYPSSRSMLQIKRSKSVGLEEDFWFGRSEEVGDKLSFCAQSANEWLDIFHLVRLVIADWMELREARDFAGMGKFLKEHNWAMDRSLSYQLEFNEQTGTAQSSIVCSSLSKYIDVQWGMSIAANVRHRQCAECPNWFSVHPGTFRPQKLFCSDACMRAYRKRKGKK